MTMMISGRWFTGPRAPSLWHPAARASPHALGTPISCPEQPVRSSLLGLCARDLGWISSCWATKTPSHPMYHPTPRNGCCRSWRRYCARWTTARGCYVYESGDLQMRVATMVDRYDDLFDECMQLSMCFYRLNLIVANSRIIKPECWVCFGSLWNWQIQRWDCSSSYLLLIW